MRSAPGGTAGPMPSSAWSWSNAARSRPPCRARSRDCSSDLPRSGSPGKFTAEQVTQILAVACEDPEASGRPVTHWTPRELADEVAKRGIVESISPRQVGRFLKIRPSSSRTCSRYWLNAKPDDPEAFARQVEAVCACYLAAPQRSEATGSTPSAWTR